MSSAESNFLHFAVAPIFLSHPENAANLSGVDGDIAVDFDNEDPNDEDRDGVWNIDELSGRWGILSNEKDADTYRMNQFL